MITIIFLAERAKKRVSTVNEKQNGRQPDVVEDAQVPQVHIESHSSLWEIFMKLSPYAFSVYLIFLVTLSCYPSVNSAIRSLSGQEPWASKCNIVTSTY